MFGFFKKKKKYEAIDEPTFDCGEELTIDQNEYYEKYGREEKMLSDLSHFKEAVSDLDKLFKYSDFQKKWFDDLYLKLKSYVEGKEKFLKAFNDSVSEMLRNNTQEPQESKFYHHHLIGLIVDIFDPINIFKSTKIFEQHYFQRDISYSHFCAMRTISERDNTGLFIIFMQKKIDFIVENIDIRELDEDEFEWLICLMPAATYEVKKYHRIETHIRHIDECHKNTFKKIASKYLDYHINGRDDTGSLLTLLIESDFDKTEIFNNAVKSGHVRVAIKLLEHGYQFDQVFEESYADDDEMFDPLEFTIRKDSPLFFELFKATKFEFLKQEFYLRYALCYGNTEQVEFILKNLKSHLDVRESFNEGIFDLLVEYQQKVDLKNKLDIELSEPKNTRTKPIKI